MSITIIFCSKSCADFEGVTRSRLPHHDNFSSATLFLSLSLQFAPLFTFLLVAFPPPPPPLLAAVDRCPSHLSRQSTVLIPGKVGYRNGPQVGAGLRPLFLLLWPFRKLALSFLPRVLLRESFVFRVTDERARIVAASNRSFLRRSGMGRARVCAEVLKERGRKEDANNAASTFHPPNANEHLFSLRMHLADAPLEGIEEGGDITHSRPISFNAVSVDGWMQCNGRRGRCLDADGDVWRWAEQIRSLLSSIWPQGLPHPHPPVSSFPPTGNDSGSFNLHYRSSRYILVRFEGIRIEVSGEQEQLGLIIAKEKGGQGERTRESRPST